MQIHCIYPSPGEVHSIEMIWLAPGVLMGLLAVVDTFLVYKIAELRYSYNRTIALIASILFAVTPFTAIIRRVWLESIQLPFYVLYYLHFIQKRVHQRRRIRVWMRIRIRTRRRIKTNNRLR